MYADASGPGVERVNGRLLVVVDVKAVPLSAQPGDDHLDVVSGAPSHLVADGLRVLGELRLTLPVASLAQLVPHECPLPLLVPLQPLSRPHAATLSDHAKSVGVHAHAARVKARNCRDPVIRKRPTPVLPPLDRDAADVAPSTKRGEQRSRPSGLQGPPPLLPPTKGVLA